MESNATDSPGLPPWFAGDRVYRALLLHTNPDEVSGVLDSAENIDWEIAASPGEVGPALVCHDPEIVLSIKHSGFPGPAHVPALRWPSVRWFHVGGSGRDHLGSDLPRRVTVTDCAGVLAPFWAERAVAAMTSLMTGMHGLARAQAAGRWAPTRFRPVAGRTLLVVGLGHTGKELAARARALGMRVVGVRASGEAVYGVDEVHGPDALHGLLPQADVLSLNVRLTDETRGLIGAEELALLPAGSIVLNGARGPVLDAEALVEALDRTPGEDRPGPLDGAWLDVFDEEPLSEISPLWNHPNVLLTPHCADQVEDFPARFAARFLEIWSSARS